MYLFLSIICIGCSSLLIFIWNHWFFFPLLCHDTLCHPNHNIWSFHWGLLQKLKPRYFQMPNHSIHFYLIGWSRNTDLPVNRGERCSDWIVFLFMLFVKLVFIYLSHKTTLIVIRGWCKSIHKIDLGKCFLKGRR